jgi:hypothetical protein
VGASINLLSLASLSALLTIGSAPAWAMSPHSSVLENSSSSLSRYPQTSAVGSILKQSSRSGSSARMPESDDSYFQNIRRYLATFPHNESVRLPSKELFNRTLQSGREPLSFRVFSIDQTSEMTIGVYRCDTGLPSCTVGTFWVSNSTSEFAQQMLHDHRTTQARLVPLTERIDGYWLEDSPMSSDDNVSSIIWRQDNLIYGVSFPRHQRQNWLSMTQHIAASAPFYSTYGIDPSPVERVSDARLSSPLEVSPEHISAQPDVPSVVSNGDAETERESSSFDWEASASATSISEPPSSQRTELRYSNDPTPNTTERAIAQPRPPALTNVPSSSVAPPRSNLAQVTSVSQLSDVQPTDWAFQALQSLVERYGCIAGQPDGTYRGTRALSRYEFAAGINACLDRINELIAAGLATKVSRDDLATLQRLQEEFAAEITTIRGRVDVLEARTDELEANQFSSTMKLSGASVFAFGAAGGGDPPGTGDGNAIFANLTALSLQGSFTEGRDLFRLNLTSANFEDGAFTQSSSLNTNMAFLSFQGDSSGPFESGGDIVLSGLEYRFATLDDRMVVVIKPDGFGLSSVLSPNSPFSNSLDEGISRFSTGSALFKIGALNAGVGIDWLPFDRFRFQVAYGARDASDPSDGIMGTSHHTLGAQLLFRPTNNLTTGLAYINAFSPDGRLDTFTGSFRSDISGGFNEFSRVQAVNGSLQWQIADNFVFGGSGGVVYTDSMTSSEFRAVSTTYQFLLRFDDLFGREGDSFGFLVGQPLKLVFGVIPGSIDPGTSIHYEAFYRFRINDHISISPGLFYVTNPGHIPDNNDIVIGILRTTFRF